MSFKLCFVFGFVFVCVSCDEFWLHRAKRTFESEVGNNGEAQDPTDEPHQATSSDGRSVDQMNIAKTLLMSHISLNRTSPESNAPVSANSHNCNNPTCLFNILTHSMRPEQFDTTTTQLSAVTRRYFGENEEIVENAAPFTTKKLTTSRPRLTFDPHQESNLQPAQYDHTPSTSSAAMVISSTISSTSTSTTVSTTTSSSTPSPTTTSVLQSSSTSKAVASTLQSFIADDVTTSSLVLENGTTSNSTIVENETTEMPGGFKITSKTTTTSQDSKNFIRPWKFGSTSQKESNGDDHVLAYMLQCGVYPACHVAFQNNSAKLFDGIGNEETRNQLIAHSRTIIVKCNDHKIRSITAFNVVLILVIVLSNFLIFFVTLNSQVLRKPHGYFKLSLAAADSLTGIIVIPSIISNTNIYFNENQNYYDLVGQQTLRENNSQAIFFGVVAVLSQLITMYSIFLLSVDSFLSIRWPVKYSIRDLMTPMRAAIMISITWALAVIVSALPIVSSSYVEYGLSYITMAYTPILKPSGSSANSLTSYTPAIVYMALVWAVPFIATWTITILTAVYGKLMLNKMKKITKRQSQNSRKSIAQLNADIVRTAVVVLLLFTITVLPCFIMLIVNFKSSNSNIVCMEKGGAAFHFAALYILLCGSFVNVLVYNFCNSEFRLETKRIFRKIFQPYCPSFCSAFCMDSLSTSKSSKTSRTRLQTYRTSKQSVKKSASSDSKMAVVSPPRPQTIGSCLEEKPASAHDVYYSNIVGLENPVFEMNVTNSNNGNRVAVDFSSGATDISNNSTEVEHHAHINNNHEMHVNEQKPEQTTTTFGDISKDADCIEYTI